MDSFDNHPQAVHIRQRPRFSLALKMTFLAWYFVRCIVDVLLNTGPSISIWDFVKFSDHNSKTLKEIIIIKVWFVLLSAGYRQISHKFDPRNDNIKYWITILKYRKRVIDHFPCEFHATTIDLHHSMVNSLISCICISDNIRHCCLWS